MSGKREILDPTPVAVPAGTRRPLTLQEEIRRFMRMELAVRQGMNPTTTPDQVQLDDEDEELTPYEIAALTEDLQDDSRRSAAVARLDDRRGGKPSPGHDDKPGPDRASDQDQEKTSAPAKAAGKS